jgi:hypothetical protein
MRSILFLFVFIILPISVAAQSTIGDTIDCTDIRIDYIDDPNLTREERLILMDKALMEAINKFELCQQQRTMDGIANSDNNESAGSNNASSSIQGNEGDGNIEQGIAGETDDAGVVGGMESTVSSSMSGTEPTPSETGIPEVATEDSQAGESVGTQKKIGEKSQGSEVGGKNKGGIKINSALEMKNGQTPDDIPDTKNDDALAAQIRYAAENEKDSEKRKHRRLIHSGAAGIRRFLPHAESPG